MTELHDFSVEVIEHIPLLQRFSAEKLNQGAQLDLTERFEADHTPILCLSQLD